MTNEELIQKMKEDMEMRGFSKYTYESYLSKTKDIIKYFKKPLEELKMEELRNYLLKYLKEERGLSERSVNYYNSVIRFIYEVTLDKVINKKQLPMYRKRKRVYKVLTKEELSAFFNACENYKYKTIFMMIYGSGLRISEALNLRIEDIDSKKMRIFVREGKGKKERYTVLPETSIEMLRKYYKKYKPKHPEGYIFLNREGKPLTVERTREFFRRYRRKAKLDEKFVVHSLRHSFATDLIERGASIIEVKEIMGHSNIRSTMEYIHVAKVGLSVNNPLDELMKGENKNGRSTRNI